MVVPCGKRESIESKIVHRQKKGMVKVKRKRKKTIKKGKSMEARRVIE